MKNVLWKVLAVWTAICVQIVTAKPLDLKNEEKDDEQVKDPFVK
jgi:hypothetical protein